MTQFVIIDTDDGKIFATSPTKSGISRKAKKLVSKYGGRRNLEMMDAAEASALRASLPQVNVRNLMNGAAVLICAWEVGTSCDPSTERYWSA
jgi:hypothetical protein